MKAGGTASKRSQPTGSMASRRSAKTAESSPVVYIQMGHDARAWNNPAYRTLVANAVKWAATPDAMAWATKNPSRIFKK